MIIVYKICERLKLKDNYRYMALLFIAFHPTMIILSGSINNDILMIFFEVLIILLLIDWYNDPSIKRTIFLAIATGFCVMTKTNGAIMAIPILYIFAKKFYIIKKNFGLQEIKSLVRKILLFGIISLPIGLWYPIRNLIKFSSYSFVLDSGNYLYTGHYSLVSRFFTISFNELFDFANFATDHNLPAYLIKSSLFGEYSFPNINSIKIIIILLCIILTGIFLVMMIRYIIKDRKNIVINTLIITFFTSIISMYVFNYLYPNICSMDFRYIVITLVSEITVIMFTLSKLKNNWIKSSIWIVLSLFIFFSVLFELMI